MDDNDGKYALSDSSSQNSTTTPKNTVKPKRRSLVERELETNLTARVTSPVTIGEASGRSSRYVRSRQLKTGSDTENPKNDSKNVATAIKSPRNEKSPVYKMHASNSPIKTESKLAPSTEISNIENQIESIQIKNVSLSRFSSETIKSKSPAKKTSKVYLKKDLIQGKVKGEMASTTQSSFSSVMSPRPSTNTHLNLLLERSMEKYSLDSSDNLNKQNGYSDTLSVVKTLDFDSGKKKKEEKATPVSKSEIFERESKCSYQMCDLAWARVGTYPFWPCIVTRDPYSDTFVKKKLFGRVERDVIHVTFFGDNGRRGWIVDNMLRKFTGLQEFEDTKANFTAEDKKKDPRFYAAFFISDKKMPTWTVSVAEAESIMREPKRTRIDALHDLLNIGRETKTTPKRPQSSKITRTDSDVSLSASLYDTLFSEDDCKEDVDKSKNRSRKTSLDVSEVVTACLDNMAAKTGLSMIQKQSHMDIWLQKAKSMTPEKPQTRLVTAKSKVKETRTSAKKRKTPLKENTPVKGYSLRKSTTGSSDDLGSIRISTAYQMNEHDYSKLHSDEMQVISSMDNNIDGMGYISKVETMSGHQLDSESENTNSDNTEMVTENNIPIKAEDHNEYSNEEKEEVPVARDNVDSDISKEKPIEMEIDSQENVDMEVDISNQEQIMSNDDPIQSLTTDISPPSASPTSAFKVTTRSQHIVIEPSDIEIIDNESTDNLKKQKSDLEDGPTKDNVENKTDDKLNRKVINEEKRDLIVENGENTEITEEVLMNGDLHYSTDEEENVISNKNCCNDVSNMETDNSMTLLTKEVESSEAQIEGLVDNTEEETENTVSDEQITKTPPLSPVTDVPIIHEDIVAESPTFTQNVDDYDEVLTNNTCEPVQGNNREDIIADSPTFTQREDDCDEIIANKSEASNISEPIQNNTEDVIADSSTFTQREDNFDEVNVDDTYEPEHKNNKEDGALDFMNQTYTQPSQDFDELVPVPNPTDECQNATGNNSEVNIPSGGVTDDFTKNLCEDVVEADIDSKDPEKEISINDENIILDTEMIENKEPSLNGDVACVSKTLEDIESVSDFTQDKLQEDLKSDTVSIDSNFDDNLPLATYIKKTDNVHYNTEEIKPKKERGRPRKKPKTNPDVERAKNNPDFMNYLELRQDALLDENPHFTEEDIILYLYKTWAYEEDMKTDTVKSDDIEQSNLVKGLGDKPLAKTKKLSLRREKNKVIKEKYVDKNEDDKDYLPTADKCDTEDQVPVAKVILSPIKVNGVNTNEYKIISNENVKNNIEDFEVKIDETDNVLKHKDAKRKTKVKPESKPVNITEANKALDDPEFRTYLELRQDAIIEENPHLTEEDVILYLYKTWIYEESLKSETVKSDEIEQSNLIKGFNSEAVPHPKKVKKHKHEKDSQVILEKNKPKRKIARAYYNENDTDFEDELQIFEIFKMKPKTKPVNTATIPIDTDTISNETDTIPVVETSSSQTDSSETDKETNLEESFDEEDFFFAELTRPKPNLFKGLPRERVCEICEQTGNLVKCKGACAGTFHIDCVKKQVETVTLQTPATRGRKKKKPRGRKPKSLDDSESQSDEKSQIEDISLEEDNLVIDAESFEAQLSVKMKELLESESNVDYYFSSGEELSFKDTVAGKCEIVDVKSIRKINESEYADFKCNYCMSHDIPLCFVCKSEKSPKNSTVLRQRCQNVHCHKYYHLDCLEFWPQTQYNSGEASKGKKVTEHKDSLTCPRHVCHTCVSDDPRGCKTRFSGDKLARCIKCPATYHSFTKCLPAGTVILSASFIICPRHYEHRPGKVPCHVNTGWCFICALGGTLICCEYCPTSFHAECLNIAPPEGNYMCEDCETGRLPLYGEMVWVKLGHYRWWPGIILHPSEIPDNIMAVKHSQGEFVVRFFGQYDHYWVNRGRVFPFQEGDSGRISSQKSKIDEAFTKAMEHAHKACEILKLVQPDTEEAADIASSLLPPHYIKLKVNKPHSSAVTIRKADDADCSLSSCDCDINDPTPCSRFSQCLNRMLLTECGPMCRAGERCQNRAFERREYPRVTPYRTPHRGWGLRTLDDIREGQFVIEYVGELIAEDEFRRRMARQHELRDENFYYLTLDKDRMIDAGPKGNLARFMNHSCEPNCETQKWTVLGDVRVGLFALYDIPANSELTFNYNLECAGIDKKPCFCGAKRCSGYIGAKPKQEETQPKKNKLTGKRTYKKRKQEESPSAYKPKTPKPRTTQRSKPKELTEIEKDLLIIKNATNGLSSDSECGGRLSSIDVDKSVKPLKRKLVSFSTEGTSVCNGDLNSPALKRTKLNESGVSEVGG